MTADEIATKLRTAWPDAIVELKDLTGTGDHWSAHIVSAVFVGKTLMERHRMVMSVLAEEMKGAIHALTLDVMTPEEDRSGSIDRR